MLMPLLLMLLRVYAWCICVTPQAQQAEGQVERPVSWGRGGKTSPAALPSTDNIDRARR
ncbi:hypothetical protein FOA52_011288 [Chlamydomonas sp. UWO 241]|nr:hypothetical protein FOA52_011288 [Chlamydomonas sp. UWO 241]